MAEANTVAALLSDFSSRVKALEEKFNLLRERVLVLTQNFLKHERELRRELALIQDEVKEIKVDQRRVSERVEGLVSQSTDFARKEEVRVAEKYFKLFEPINFVTASELRGEVEKILSEKGRKPEKERQIARARGEREGKREKKHRPHHVG